MKTWENPEMAVLDLDQTLYGDKITTKIDEVRTDGNKNNWYTFDSGAPECTNHE